MIAATDTRSSVEPGSPASEASSSPDNPQPLAAQAVREARIRQAAYAAAERRGFEPGFEMQDWLEAEREVDAQGQAPAADQAP